MKNKPRNFRKLYVMLFTQELYTLLHSSISEETVTVHLRTPSKSLSRFRATKAVVHGQAASLCHCRNVQLFPQIVRYHHCFLFAVRQSFSHRSIPMNTYTRCTVYMHLRLQFPHSPAHCKYTWKRLGQTHHAPAHGEFTDSISTAYGDRPSAVDAVFQSCLYLNIKSAPPPPPPSKKKHIDTHTHNR